MKYKEKLNIIIDLYIQGQIDKEDYIKYRKQIEPRTKMLHDIIREKRK